MKIIHTADIHLDSPLTGVADGKMRRAELLRAFSNMVNFAENNSVEAIIVAGDLFDESYVSAPTLQSVAQIIAQSSAKWYILRGNHGSAAPYEKLQQLCPNVNYFGQNFTVYNLGDIAIIGRELGQNDQAAWQNFRCEPNLYNILVLHGDVDDDTYGLIDKKAIAAHPVNYVALGHLHKYTPLKFGRVKGSYCGVLESRGFDERQTSGFVLLDTAKDTVTFCESYIRKVESVTIDVSGLTNEVALEKHILDSVADVSLRNYLNVEFVGTLAEGVRLMFVAEQALQSKYFALRLKDNTTTAVNWQSFADEVSLRGEFVKLVQTLPEDTREEVLRMGLAVLADPKGGLS